MLKRVLGRTVIMLAVIAVLYPPWTCEGPVFDGAVPFGHEKAFAGFHFLFSKPPFAPFVMEGGYRIEPAVCSINWAVVAIEFIFLLLLGWLAFRKRHSR